MDIEIAASTDRGRKRRRNEDRVTSQLLSVEGVRACLLAVADGVGGAPAGDTASALAISSVDGWLPTGDPVGGLAELFQDANRAIVRQATGNASARGMATTLVVALVIGDDLWVANVGDSRAYLVRNGDLQQITRDHSLVAERVSAGFISEAEAAHSPQRSVITRSLGCDTPPEVDIFGSVSLRNGDVVLLCSDGLYTMVPDKEIAVCASSLEPTDAVRELVRQANRHGGLDNIAVAIARVTTTQTISLGNGDAH